MYNNELLKQEDMLNPLFEAFFGPTSHYSEELPMNTDIYEDKDNYYFEIDAAGCDKDGIGIVYKDGYLTIKIERKVKDVEGAKYLRKERYNAKAARSFWIGKKVDEKTIAANFENGLLKITFPKVNPNYKESDHKIEIR